MVVLTNIEMESFKNLRHVNLELNPLNILTGKHNIGKSNLLSLFEFLSHLVKKELKDYCEKKGGISRLSFRGKNQENNIYAALTLKENGNIYLYGFEINLDGNDYFFEDEYVGAKKSGISVSNIGLKGPEAGLRDQLKKQGGKVKEASLFYNYLSNTRVYQFTDTSPESPLRKAVPKADALPYHPNGHNLSAYFYHLYENDRQAYNEIETAITATFSNIEAFSFRLSGRNSKVQVLWTDKDTGMKMLLEDLSDGALRLLAHALLLVIPRDKTYIPSLILIEEAACGMYKTAFQQLVKLLRKASEQVQIIATTQNQQFVSALSPTEVIIAENDENGLIRMRRKGAGDIQRWQNVD